MENLRTREVRVVRLGDPTLELSLGGQPFKSFLSDQEAKELGLVWGEDGIIRVADLFQ